MILTLLIVLPLLIYSPPNNGPDLSVAMLQAFNTAGNDVSPEAKKLALDVFKSSLGAAYHNRFIGRWVEQNHYYHLHHHYYHQSSLS